MQTHTPENRSLLIKDVREVVRIIGVERWYNHTIKNRIVSEEHCCGTERTDLKLLY